MALDFTFYKYSDLISELKAYDFQKLTLRHDVDLNPNNSLRAAQLEAEKSIYVYNRPKYN